MINMPKTEKAPIAHRSSISTASAAGGSTRSSSWSAQDDEALIQARTQGLNWNQIAPKHFPSKSPNACRKRHERLMERMNAEQWDGVKLDVLAQAYMDVRREMWSLLAARVNEKWQLVETKCMEKGLKNLSQAARSASKKQGFQGTYADHEDSAIGVSDFDEESDDHHTEMVMPVASAQYPQYAGSYPSQQQRVPSIQSMLHQHSMQYASHQLVHPHTHAHTQPQSAFPPSN
ncbi:lipoamidase activity, variant 2 [Ascochyta rabiei]|uniref:lipoamidase activity, variant 2 n=1 Tax=Didymella rabiei TaxID=5454 RepID=UPI00220CF2FD|nr:lipoamidase activity, variant 2 [Ascochyta rabiei]UPX13943.1 lipoamidase activity, variant 2 [Ascochyta rabiei]